jgi:hypothetical protein
MTRAVCPRPCRWLGGCIQNQRGRGIVIVRAPPFFEHYGVASSFGKHIRRIAAPGSINNDIGRYRVVHGSVCLATSAGVYFAAPGDETDAGERSISRTVTFENAKRSAWKRLAELR